MSPPIIPSRTVGPPRPFPTGYIVVSGLLGLFLLSIIGITGYFRLSSDTTVLRQSLMSSVPGTWDKKIALRVGFFTTSLVKLGSQFFNLPPEPRAALNAVQGVEVGVYRLQETAAPLDRATMLARADKVMSARGWERLVGVIQGDQLVAIFLPQNGVSAHRVKCCVLVFNGSDLVVASAHANLGPLLQLAHNQVDLHQIEHHLVLR